MIDVLTDTPVFQILWWIHGSLWAVLCQF